MLTLWSGGVGGDFRCIAINTPQHVLSRVCASVLGAQARSDKVSSARPGPAQRTPDQHIHNSSWIHGTGGQGDIYMQEDMVHEARPHRVFKRSFSHLTVVEPNPDRTNPENIHKQDAKSRICETTFPTSRLSTTLGGTSINPTIKAIVLQVQEYFLQPKISISQT